MPDTNPNDIVRVTAKLAYNTGTDDVQNVYHLKMSGIAADDALVHYAISLWLETAYSEILTRIPTTTTFETIATWNVTQDRPMVEDPWPTLTAGAGTGETMPAQCAPLILFSTAVARSQGRKYLPFLREADMSGGVLSTAAMTDITDLATRLLTQVTGAGWSLIAGNWNDVKVRFAAWAAAVVRDVIRTQRRRVRGVGS